jgi:hypothetical protein
MTWNDLCWNDWEGVSCGYTAVVTVVIILVQIALVIKVIGRTVGWPRWLRRSGAAMTDIHQDGFGDPALRRQTSINPSPTKALTGHTRVPCGRCSYGH